jgi:hypothetical protein
VQLVLFETNEDNKKTNLKYFVGASVERKANDIVSHKHVMKAGVTRKNKQDPEQFKRRSRRNNLYAILRQFWVQVLVDRVLLADGLQRVEDVVERVERRR